MHTKNAVNPFLKQILTQGRMQDFGEGGFDMNN